MLPEKRGKIVERTREKHPDFGPTFAGEKIYQRRAR